jgi:hypothetical protein
MLNSKPVKRGIAIDTFPGHENHVLLASCLAHLHLVKIRKTLASLKNPDFL